ncbi:MAG: hypothetical protein WDA09_00050 [Bacteriovoracaceae bacterium]
MKYLVILLIFSTSTLARSLEDAQNKYPKEHQEIIEVIQNDDFLEPEDYETELKEIYFSALNEKVKNFKKSGIEDKDIPLLVSILESLEYKEQEVMTIGREISDYKKMLIAKKWNREFHLNASFISFQRHITLKSPSQKQKLINTAKASCLGGGFSYKNSFWSLQTEGCFLIGESNLKEKKGSPQYKESAVPLWGAKLTQRFGMVVSSSGAELGLSIPLIFTSQNLKNPPGSYKVKDDNSFTFAPALYGKWALGKLFLATEIGQFTDQSNTYYSIGIGAKF